VKERILITGASGLLGSSLGIKLSASGHDVQGIRRSHPKALPFPETVTDLTNRDSLANLVQVFSPTVIVHCAALSKVLECQSNPETAELQNVIVTSSIAELALESKCYLIFISTDQVFDGHSAFRSETDSPAPTHVYGITKLEAERSVSNASPEYLILRSNNIVGKGAGWGASFTDGLLTKLRANEVVDLFTDQFRSPIHISAMTSIIAGCIEKRVAGILHAGGPERLSRFETVKKLTTAYGISTNLLRSAIVSDHPQSEFLHVDGSFATDKLRALFPEYGNETVFDGFLRDRASELA
jgi:dTDP-4-dehydrorhamnose reductase